MLGEVKCARCTGKDLEAQVWCFNCPQEWFESLLLSTLDSKKGA